MKRSNKGVIVILILIILALASYIVYDNFFASKEKCSESEEICEIPNEETSDDNNELTLNEKACLAFEQMLENDSTVSNYTINSCQIIADCYDDEEKLILNVNYDVTSPTQDQMWIAGNGNADNDTLTVNGKQNYVVVNKENDSYIYTSMATGILNNSETSKPDICD